MTRSSGRTDTNQTAVIKALRKAGCSVQSLSDIGRGCPDLLVGTGYETVLFEVKDGSKPPSARSLTPDQVRWHSSWRGPVYVVESVVAALNVVSLIRRKEERYSAP